MYGSLYRESGSASTKLSDVTVFTLSDKAQRVQLFLVHIHVSLIVQNNNDLDSTSCPKSLIICASFNDGSLSFNSVDFKPASNLRGNLHQ